MVSVTSSPQRFVPLEAAVLEAVVPLEAAALEALEAVVPLEAAAARPAAHHTGPAVLLRSATKLRMLPTQT